MSRLPPALARRVDRLARRAHAFHRWAHHPLCSWYAGEVIRAGRRTRVCLGCSLAGLGTVAGMAAGMAIPPAPGIASMAAGAMLLAAVPLIVRPSASRAPLAGRASPRPGLQTPLALSLSKGERSRARKLVTRLLPTAAVGFLVAQAILAPSPSRLAAAALAAVAVGWVILRYRQRGPDRSTCDACPDGPPGSRCPGLAPIARRERALSRLAGRWIAAAPPASAPPPPPRPSPAAPPASSPTAPRPS